MGDMVEQSEQRRLAAIFAADMVGYSRLMEADERGTLARQKTHMAELIDPEIAGHKGRIVKLMGDGMLVEFASAVDAVTCAIDIQRAMVTREPNVEEKRRIRYRVGIHVGDIIIDGDDIFGNGVIIAARLEALAEPGGITISAAVHDHLKGNVDAIFDDMGDQSVKNITHPIRAWRWRADEFEALRADGKDSNAEDPTRVAPLPLPDKPSIAVLPFDNMSGDPEQEYFSDGLTEDLLTALSKSGDLFVIARNSSFAFRGGDVDVQIVGQKLGARYVLEGSVRRSGNQVRITAQLIEAASRNHIWAERFDGSLENVFELQDAVVAQIAGQLLAKLERAETERASRLNPDEIGAYDFYLRAIHHFHAFSSENISTALNYLEQALAIRPDYPPALALSGLCRVRMINLTWDNPKEQEHMKSGLVAARRAAELAPEDARVLWMSGFAIGRLSNDLDGGIDLLERAIRLNPNSYQAYGYAGFLKCSIGDAGGAIEYLKQAIRLNPIDPRGFFLHASLATAYNYAKNHDLAKRHALMALQLNSRYHHSHREYVVSCVGSGKIEDARAGVQKLLSQFPNFSISELRDRWERQQRPTHQGVIELFEALRKAGLPE